MKSFYELEIGTIYSNKKILTKKLQPKEYFNLPLLFAVSSNGSFIFSIFKILSSVVS